MEFAQRELGLTCLTAKTTTHNEASVKVLEKLGFVKSHTEVDAVVLNGQVLSFLHFIKQLA
ncbi:GNAT family N-acetyltransferase [Vibrio mexicanus]|uniref:GNAT family N-acetyltransferase n=1 Tax=Vibrio mexicanus TaxID=1004326 RepID=UPI003B50054C